MLSSKFNKGHINKYIYTFDEKGRMNILKNGKFRILYL